MIYVVSIDSNEYICSFSFHLQVKIDKHKTIQLR